MAKDLTGIRKGRLVAIRVAYKKNHRNVWECQCDCGNKAYVDDGNFCFGTTVSCGCVKKENFEKVQQNHIKHNQTKTETYKSWLAMKSRCYNVNNPRYNCYGDRNIKVCDRWLHSFENFLEDMGERPKGSSLDRIDVNGDYTPNNCRWATSFQQGNNRRNTKYLDFDGERKSLSEWSKLLGIKRNTLYSRLSSGWSIEKTLNTPVKA